MEAKAPGSRARLRGGPTYAVLSRAPPSELLLFYRDDTLVRTSTNQWSRMASAVDPSLSRALLRTGASGGLRCLGQERFELRDGRKLLYKQPEARLSDLLCFRSATAGKTLTV